MREVYKKLVRDRIPEIIHKEGRRCEIRVLEMDAYREALRAKVLEEAEEIRTAPESDLPKEIADLYEAIDSMIAAFALDPVRDPDAAGAAKERTGQFCTTLGTTLGGVKTTPYAIFEAGRS